MSNKKSQSSAVKEVKHRSGLPFSRAALKDLVLRHIVSKKTRISKEGLDLLNRVLDEISGWIIMESEKMVSYSGKSTIKAEHIRSAVKLYLGGEEEK